MNKCSSPALLCSFRCSAIRNSIFQVDGIYCKSIEIPPPLSNATPPPPPPPPPPPSASSSSSPRSVLHKKTDPRIRRKRRRRGGGRSDGRRRFHISRNWSIQFRRAMESILSIFPLPAEYSNCGVQFERRVPPIIWPIWTITTSFVKTFN